MFQTNLTRTAYKCEGTDPPRDVRPACAASACYNGPSHSTRGIEFRAAFSSRKGVGRGICRSGSRSHHAARATRALRRSGVHRHAPRTPESVDRPDGDDGDRARLHRRHPHRTGHDRPTRRCDVRPLRHQPRRNDRQPRRLHRRDTDVQLHLDGRRLVHVPGGHHDAAGQRQAVDGRDRSPGWAVRESRVADRSVVAHAREHVLVAARLPDPRTGGGADLLVVRTGPYLDHRPGSADQSAQQRSRFPTAHRLGRRRSHLTTRPRTARHVRAEGGARGRPVQLGVGLRRRDQGSAGQLRAVAARNAVAGGTVHLRLGLPGQRLRGTGVSRPWRTPTRPRRRISASTWRSC